MSRRIPLALLALLLVIVMSGHASAATYYIAANGSDSNSGTSNTSPWLHAPGMHSCSGTCGSTTPKAGDSFIFRGGDTWHFSNSGAVPYSGGTWTWSWAGSSSGCQLDASSGSVVKTSCIYIGVDQTWFSGSSWQRPILTMDNPLTTTRPSSCTYDNDGFNGLFLGQNYLIFDNFDLQGECWTGSPNSAWVTVGGNQVEVTNSYFHGWTFGSPSNTDEFRQIAWMNGAGFVLVDHNVFDGSDSSLGATQFGASGFALGTGTEIAFNVFNKVSNGCICNPLSVHDNLFENMFEPQAGTHGNVIEWNGMNSGVVNISLYNNVTHDIDEGITFVLVPSGGGHTWIFNNVYYHVANGVNCLMINANNQTLTSPVTSYIYNNTLDTQTNVEGNTNGGCFVNFDAGFSGTAYFENDHLVNFSSSSLSSVWLNGGGVISLTVNDNGGEMFQTESVANGQGYVAGDNYGPTATSDATVGAGANLTSYCNGIGNSVTAAACKVGVGTLAYNTSNHTVGWTPGNTRPSTGAWDSGAYQYSASNSQPSPPSSLAAVVQ